MCICVGMSHWDLILRMRLLAGENELEKRGISQLEESSLIEFFLLAEEEEVGLLVQVTHFYNLYNDFFLH